MASVEDTLNRQPIPLCNYVIAEQTKALKELRAENERLAGMEALTCANKQPT